MSFLKDARSKLADMVRSRQAPAQISADVREQERAYGRLPGEVPDEWVKVTGPSERLARQIQPDRSKSVAPCAGPEGHRRVFVDTRPLRRNSKGQPPVIDVFCWKPNCLINGGTCTGIRYVPDPSVDRKLYPMAELVEIGLSTRRMIKDQLKGAAPNEHLTARAVEEDIVTVRRGFNDAVMKPGSWTPS